MAQLNYLTISEEVVTDSKTNKISIVNIFNRVGAPVLPAQLSKLVVAFAFRPEGEDFVGEELNIKIKVINPSGNDDLVITGKGKLNPFPDDIDNDTRELANSFDIANKFAVTAYGTYKIQLFINDKILGERAFTLVPIKEEP